MRTLTEIVNEATSPLNATAPMVGVSENYGFIPTRPIIEALESKGFELQSAKQARVLKAEKLGKQKHELRFTFGPNDGESVLQLRVINSHDRTSALSFYLGWFRLICENGLVAGEHVDAAFKLYHTGKRLSAQVDELIDRILETAPRLTETRQLWSSMPLTHAENVFLSKAAAEMLAIEFKRPVTFESALTLGAQRREGQQTLWTVYNDIQESIMHGDFAVNSLRGDVMRRVKARPIKAIDADLKVNRALFDLVHNFASAKLAGEVFNG